MALSIVETQVTWSAASSITLSNATQTDSDTFTLHDSCISASVQIYVDNQNTTPQAGDTLATRIKWSSGDILGNAADTFDTNQHSQNLGLFDTVAANTPGEDPAARTFHLSLGGARKFKLSVVAAQAASRNLVVRARVVEQRAA